VLLASAPGDPGCCGARLRRRRPGAAAEPAAFDAWLGTAAEAGLGGFAAGFRQDRAAVRAAVAEPWSNGSAEGQINRSS
jgi:transposase